MTGSSALIAFMLCLQGAAEPATSDLAAETAAADEKLLRERKIATDGPGLLLYLRQRTLTPDFEKQIAEQVRRLGDENFETRQTASMELRRIGRPALAALREAEESPDAEVARRAQECIEAIESRPGPIYTRAVCRRLSKLAPDGAAEVLLAYAPYADDDRAGDEACAALLAVTPRGRPGACILTALDDPLVLRRAAAAYIAGRAEDGAVRNRVAKLLADPDALVRFRAAEGLLMARDRRAVAVLTGLLAEGPVPLSWRAEEYLQRLAGEHAPLASVGTSSVEDRKKWRDTWTTWWQDNGDKVDLAHALDGLPYLGHIVVPEIHNERIMELGRDNKPLWEMKNTHMPRDAQILPGGRVLVCECGDENRVAEYSIATGKLLWSHPVKEPSYAQRLANGNTFIGTHTYSCEVTAEGKELYRHNADADFLIHSTYRYANGNIVWLSMDGSIRELTAAGEEVRRIEIPVITGANWCGIEGLPGGRYLIVALSGCVIEIDSKGRELWKCKIYGSSYASRLPTGNTLICSFNGKRIVEVDRDGAIVREVTLTAMPWRVHSR